MLRVVHLFDLGKGVSERDFIPWLDAKLDSATTQFGCVERKSWQLLDGFGGSYVSQKPLKARPRFVTEAYWTDAAAADRFREWLTGTTEGRALHDRWFGSITNHTVLRYVDGWIPVPMEG